MSKWITPRDLVDLVEDVFPATESSIREFCEEGTIPPRFAKRSKMRLAPDGTFEATGHWRIATRGLRWILLTVLQLAPDELQEVQAKAPRLNFKVMAA